MPISPPKNHMLHPGEVLVEIYMKDRGLNQAQLANAMKCSHAKINEICNGRRGISAEFALDLAEFFGTSAELWGRLQSDYDIFVRRRKREKKLMMDDDIKAHL